MIISNELVSCDVVSLYKSIPHDRIRDKASRIRDTILRDQYKMELNTEVLQMDLFQKQRHLYNQIISLNLMIVCF